MTKLEQIEKSVTELTKEELRAFADWFAESRPTSGIGRSRKM